MDSINVQELVERLGSDEVAVHKMAVFKLQSIIGDPSFADVFILEGGLTKLRYMALHASGNTLAYCLTSLSRLLETDKGWEYVDRALVERVMVIWDSFQTLTNGIVGCGACCHAPTGQYPAGRYVHPRLHCLPSLHCLEQDLTARLLWVPSLKASYSCLSTIFGDACQQTVLGRSCIMFECPAPHQLANARDDHQRLGI